MKDIRLRHIILFLLMAVFVTPIRASIHTDYLLGGSLIVNANLQPYKYNGKELDLMHGLNKTVRLTKARCTGRLQSVDSLLRLTTD
jgi:hypothetical protein